MRITGYRVETVRVIDGQRVNGEVNAVGKPDLGGILLAETMQPGMLLELNVKATVGQ